jgi:TonB-linked SusC/RagA family outer membrane protein
MTNATCSTCAVTSRSKRNRRVRLAGLALLSAMLAVPAGVAAQQTGGTILGRVISVETREPVAGALVTVEGTPLRALTGENGRFLIRAVRPGTHRLTIRILGYADRTVEGVSVTGSDPALVETELVPQAVQLAEVVAVGYGAQRRATITGAVSSVTGAELARAPVPNLVNAMAGRTAGVIINNRSGVPGSENISVLIRGAGALSNNGPLYVIDGVAGRGGLSRLNPDEIESVTILKDASAALYGAQAGNGVILITTRQGGGPPRATVNMNYGFSGPTALTRLVDSWDYAVYVNELNRSLGNPALYTQEQIDLFRSGSDQLRYPNTNWIDVITRPRAPQKETRVDVSGGTAQVRYFVSGQYLNQEGIFVEPSPLRYDQYSMRSNVTAQLHENLNLQLRVGGRYEARDNSNQNADGIFVTAASNYPVQNARYPNGMPSTGIEFNNPLVRAQGLTGYNKERDFLLNSTLNFTLQLPNILEGLYVTGLGAFDVGYDDEKTFNNTWDWVEYDPATDTYTNYRDRTGNRSLSRTLGNSSRRTYNLRVGLDRVLGRHQIQSFVAHERSQFGSQELSGFRTGYVSDQIQELDSGPTEGWTNGGESGQAARMHYFGRVSYSFDDKYMTELTVRHDGSDRFPPATRWGTFPSVSAAWRISREPFFKVPVFNDLKLKASWGRLGSDNAGNYQFLARYSTSSTAYIFGSNPVRVPGLNPAAEPNPSITWETVDKWNTGVEATLGAGKLTLDLNVFWDDRDGLLIQRNASVPSYTGLSLPQQNLGRTKKKGFDGSITYASRYGGLTYSVSPNFVYAKSEIAFIDEAENTPEHQRREGDQIDSFLLYRDCGLFRSQAEIDARPHLSGTQPGDICFVDVNGDGNITPLDRIRVYDSPTPRFQGGLITATGYKGFNLDMVWQFQTATQVDVRPQAINAPVTPPKWLFDGRWTPENPDAKWPQSFDRRNTRNAETSTFWLRDASYVRLKSAQLSYEVPPSLTSRIFALDGMRVYVQGFNLWVPLGLEGYDPELNVVNTYNYPQQRVVNFGVSATLGGVARQTLARGDGGAR